jgi:transcription termination/antitermination protein NusG
VVALQHGDEVRIIAGPYRGFRGQVQDADSEHARVSVVVPIFGRPTRLELDESKVERL